MAPPPPGISARACPGRQPRIRVSWMMVNGIDVSQSTEPSPRTCNRPFLCHDLFRHCGASQAITVNGSKCSHPTADRLIPVRRITASCFVNACSYQACKLPTQSDVDESLIWRLALIYETDNGQQRKGVTNLSSIWLEYKTT